MLKLKRIICGALCLAAIFAAVITYYTNKKPITEDNKTEALTLWQIDGFEGGTGSRAAYLQNLGNKYKEQGGGFINVISLSAAAARKNIEAGNVPDIISFASGAWGLESAFNREYKIDCWCYGSYCLLSLDENADFSQANSQNTVINIGKDNLSGATAVFADVYGADVQSSTYAYVDLINGKYDFLLGTQRDIYRLNARGLNYSVKPITGFNDLYQLIAVCAADGTRASASNGFKKFILENSSDVYKLGLMGGETGKNDLIAQLENIEYEYKLQTPISFETSRLIQNAIQTKDINKLKSLFK